MSAQHYHADAWGGVPVHELYGGRSVPGSTLCPSSAHPIQAQWDDTEIPDQQFCMSTSSKTNMQCRAYKVKGEEHCTFHLRAILRKREAQTDGSEP